MSDATLAGLGLNDRKERFSLAWIRAVAAQAGFDVVEPGLDRDSRDGTVQGFGGRRPRLDFQAKSTAAPLPADPAEDWPFDLPSGTYELLRNTDLLVPHILFLVVVPTALDAWVDARDDAMMLRRAGFWVSLRGQPASANDSTVRIRVPARQRLTAAALGTIMARIAAGEPV